MGSTGPLEASSLLLSCKSKSSFCYSASGSEVHSGERADTADETSWSQGNTMEGGPPERLFPRKDRSGKSGE